MKKIILFCAVMVFLASCKEEILPEPPLNLIVASETKVIDHPTNQSLIEITSNKLVFSGSSSVVNGIKAGDILVSDTSEKAPYGYLRRVISVSQNGNSLTVNTEQATLEDAIVQCDVNFSKSFTPNDTLVYKNEFIAFEGTIETVLYDKDGNNSTTGDQVKLAGSYSVQPAFILDLKIKRKKLKYCKLGMRVVENCDLNLYSEGTLLHLDPSAEIFRKPLNPVVFWIGPVPVVFTSYLVITVGVNGELMARVETGVTNNTTVEAYAEYKDGTWTPVFSQAINSTYRPITISGTLGVKGYISPSLEYQFYDLEDVKASVSAEAYLKFQGTCLANQQNSQCDWELSAGVSADANLNVRVFSNTIADLNLNLFDYEKVIASNHQNITFFDLHNPTVEWSSTLNDCWMDVNNAYGSRVTFTFNYDPTFDPTQPFLLELFGNFEGGIPDYDPVNSFAPSISYNTTARTISCSWCILFTNSDYGDQTIVISNENYRSNGLTFRVYRPAGAYKTENGYPGSKPDM